MGNIYLGIFQITLEVKNLLFKMIDNTMGLTLLTWTYPIKLSPYHIVT